MKPGVRCNTVVFDCDSTLSDIEGIEFLGDAHKAEIAELTERAMSGEVPLEDVYARRLELVRPTRAQLEQLGREYVLHLVPHARETVAALQAEGIRVAVISGGVLQGVLPVALELGIAQHDVAAVDMHFDSNGEYAGFDRASPLARSGGKAEVLALWRASVPAPIMLVGDGATDLEAKPAVDVFVAFAGVAARPAVIAGAHVVVHDNSLAPILPLALGGAQPSNPAAADLYNHGLALLAARHTGG